MDAGRRQAEHDVACLDPRPVDQPVALDDPDARAGEVELVVAVDPRQLCCLAAQDRATRVATDGRRALDELGHLLGVDPVRSDVVEQDERVGAGREDVVDAVCGQVDAAPAQLPGPSREHELRADAVGRGDEQALLIERVQPGEGSERTHDTGRARRLDGRADAIDDRVRGRERDPCGGIGLLLRRHQSSVATGRAARRRY